jgi:hypothetical protein
MAEEAWVSERSEFPCRAISLRSTGDRRAAAACVRRRRFCFLLPRQKEVLPARHESSALVVVLISKFTSESTSKAFTLLRSASYFCPW